jgi:SAM-dependent methyltransferase
LKIKHCRLCQSPSVQKVIDLGYHPLADTFLSEDLLFGPEITYPLQLGLCRSCGHVFTLCSVSPEDRYQKNDYSYDSSNSKVSIEHFKEFARDVISKYEITARSLIVDVGSNVGTLLSHFKNETKCRVLGVEPSKNIADIALKNEIPTINDFFAPQVVGEIKGIGEVDVVVSANVFNHADDLGAVLETAKGILKRNGALVFEVPYLAELVKRTAFDTIYHEHVHYHSIKPLSRFLERHGFFIHDVEVLDYMCGSMRVHATLNENSRPIAREMIKQEELLGLFEPSTYSAFMARVQKVKFSVNSYLAKVRSEGGKVIGIGAATKGNTLLNYCKLDSDFLAYVTDSSPLKINKLTPGSHIPIVSDEDIDAKVTHALILPWNIADFLKKKLAHLNVEFFVPQVEVLSSNLEKGHPSGNH